MGFQYRSRAEIGVVQVKEIHCAVPWGWSLALVLYRHLLSLPQKRGFCSIAPCSRNRKAFQSAAEKASRSVTMSWEQLVHHKGRTEWQLGMPRGSHQRFAMARKGEGRFVSKENLGLRRTKKAKRQLVPYGTFPCSTWLFQAVHCCVDRK